MNKTCIECGAKCCKYFCFQIDEPDDYAEFEDVRWYLLHEGVTVHIDEGDWYISIANRCKMLTNDNRCRAYETRPTICRKYSPANCDYTAGDYGYDEYFETADQLEAYARKTLGEAVFQRERAKAWAKPKPKARKKSKVRKKRKRKSKARKTAGS
ncbi:MAG: YkgJ family cysteine cluster protein [Planctomycetes bacterium]|nr:YkgJ family cysteine cluster protein [Planctomycetota bacterium]